MAEGILTLNPISPERDPDKLGGPGYIEAPVGAGIGLALANFLKDKNKENLPEKIDEDKKKEEPPEDPDFIPEILNLKEVGEREEVPMMDDYKTEEDFWKALEESQKWFPFSKEDFEKGSLDNKIIKKAYKFVRGDDHDPPQPFDRDKFYITPPRGQQEIALKFLKQKLIEDEANSKVIDHITTLQKELSERIENTGYYGEGEAEKTPIGKALSEAYGYVKDLKRKKNAKGGMIDKPLTGRSRYI